MASQFGDPKESPTLWLEEETAPLGSEWFASYSLIDWDEGDASLILKVHHLPVPPPRPAPPPGI